MVIIFFIFQAAIFYLQINSKEIETLVKTEGYLSLDLLYLLLIYRYKCKIKFYRHQNFSLIIVISMGLLRYFIQLIFIKVIEFNVLSFIIFLIIPPLESLFLYIAEKYMKFKYFSPFFVSFIIGSIFTIIGIIILFISLNIDFANFEFLKSLFPNYTMDTVSLILYIIFYFLISIQSFFQFKLIYDLNVFYLIFFNSFFNLISIIIYLILDYNPFRFILLFAVVIEIIAISIFIEILELNFCNLNINLKRNIIFRAESEFNSIYQLDEEDSSIDEANSISNNDQNDSNDNNTIY